VISGQRGADRNREAAFPCMKKLITDN